MAKTEEVEEMVKGHGYSIELKVREDGTAVVTLKSTPSSLRSGSQAFSADSGSDNGLSRYQTALAIAADRMLDYEYRSNRSERPTLLSRR